MTTEEHGAARGQALDDDDRAVPVERFLGKVVRETRTNQGLTIAELAEQSGLSRGMVSKIENGQVSTSLASLVNIARALGISCAQCCLVYYGPQFLLSLNPQQNCASLR